MGGCLPSYDTTSTDDHVLSGEFDLQGAAAEFGA